MRSAIASAAKATGIDFAYLTAQASIESRFDTDAKAKTSSAAGLYQFIETTWADMVGRHGHKIGLQQEAEAIKSGDLSSSDRRKIMDLRFDAGIAARMGAEFAAENRSFLESRLGREPSPTDLYMAHFLGPGGAAKFLSALDSNPDGVAAEAFPAAAKANHNVFYKRADALSFQQIHDRFAKKLAARADDLGPAPPEPAGPIPFDATLVAAAQAPQASSAPRSPVGPGGDAYLSALLTAQMNLNEDLTRVRAGGPEPTGYDRSLL